MGVRQYIERHKTWVVPLILVLGVAGVLYTVRGYGTDDELGAPITRAFYTVDDGKTFFADEVSKPSPFDHGGKPAYSVFIARCGRGAPYALYLSRYKEAGGPVEIRRPGESKFVPMLSPEGEAIVRSKCPDGDQPEAVRP